MASDHVAAHPIGDRQFKPLFSTDQQSIYLAKQPTAVSRFKQAHHEIYGLTDAERQTEIYSNRFAAHILKQHQLAALCQARGWAYRLQGRSDSINSPIKALSYAAETVEFRVTGENSTEQHQIPGSFFTSRLIKCVFVEATKQ